MSPAGREHAVAQRAQVLFGELKFGWVGALDEVDEHAGEAAGLVELREVAGVVEDLQAAARYAPMGDRGVLDREEWIPTTPDDQGGDHLCQVEPVGSAHSLSGEVDHRAPGVQERATSLGVAEGGVAAHHLGQVVAELQAQAFKGLPDRVAHGAQARVGNQRQKQLGARKAGCAQQRVHLGAQPTAVDEYEPLAEYRVLVGELHRDAATQRMADHGRPPVAQHDEEIAKADRVGPERVVASWLGGLAVAQEVRGNDRVAIGELRNDLGPLTGVAGDPVDEQDDRALAGRAVADPVAVENGDPDAWLTIAGRRASGAKGRDPGPAACLAGRGGDPRWNGTLGQRLALGGGRSGCGRDRARPAGAQVAATHAVTPQLTDRASRVTDRTVAALGPAGNDEHRLEPRRRWGSVVAWPVDSSRPGWQIPLPDRSRS